jgi:methyl-accepting chemotaxis protein
MKKEAIYDILGVIINSIFDILYRFICDHNSKDTFPDYITEINTFLEHIREMLDNIQSRYGGKTLVLPYFD